MDRHPEHQQLVGLTFCVLGYVIPSFFKQPCSGFTVSAIMLREAQLLCSGEQLFWSKNSCPFLLQTAVLFLGQIACSESSCSGIKAAVLFQKQLFWSQGSLPVLKEAVLVQKPLFCSRNSCSCADMEPCVPVSLGENASLCPFLLLFAANQGDVAIDPEKVIRKFLNHIVFFSC